MTHLVGILNMTPDSFSGDGLRNLPQQAIAHIDQLISDGAGVVDVGAESTRPGATLLSPEEEWERFAPIMQVIKTRIHKVCFSIDTRHAETAKKFLQIVGKENAERVFVNDVSGGSDAELIKFSKDNHVTLIIMHSLTVPADPKVTIDPHDDAVEVIFEWAKRAIHKFGNNIIIDPGIGFGKTAEQSVAILMNISRIKSLGVKVMVGHSRKSFLSLYTNKPAGERDPETLIFSRDLIQQGVDYLRVHDVKSHAKLIKEMKEKS